MAVKTWTCLYKVMNVCGSTGNVITDVRDKYSSIPSHHTEAGVGGTGAKESKPNNISFIRFDGLNTQIPKGAKVESAILSWAVNGADWRKSVRHKVQGCANFDNTLTGKNQPILSGPVSEYVLPEKPVSEAYPFTADITPVVQSLVNSNLYCIKVFTSPGENRKFLSGTCTLTVTYSATTGIPGISILNTDCNTASYAHNEITVQAQRPSGVSESDTVYYQYKIVCGALSYTSSWITNTQFTLPMLGVSGNINTITINSSLFVEGQLPTSSTPITVTKNVDPTIAISVIAASNLVTNPTHIVVNGNATFRVVATDTSLKKNTAGSLKFFVNDEEAGSFSGLTNNFAHSFAAGKTYSVYAEFSDGFVTVRSSTLIVKGASPIKITLSGEPISVSKYRCDIGTNITATAEIQDSGVAINSLVINSYKIEAGVTTALASKSGAVSPQILALTIPNYTSANAEIKYYFTITARSSINQEYSFSTINAPVIINRKCNAISGLALKRQTPDIFGNLTNAQDEAVGYSNFYIPNQDKVSFLWNPSFDADIDDVIKYKVSNPESYEYTPISAYDYVYEFTGLNQSKQFSISATDGYNSTADSVKTIYGANEIETLPTVTITCYDTYLGSGTPITINGNQVVDVTSTYLPNGEITDLIQISVLPISVNSTIQNHMRFEVDLYILHENAEPTIYKKFISNPGEFSMFIQHGLQTDAETKLVFVVYYLDRFNNSNMDVWSISDYYEVRKLMQVPQVMGTLGTGYRWLFGTMPAAEQRGNLNKPIFFCKVLNPNEATYKVQMELYNSSKALVEVCEGVKPNVSVLGRVSEYAPSENLFAWRYNTELVPGNSYYVILKILTVSDVLVAKTAFNENSMFIYSNSYEGKVSTAFWAKDVIERTEHTNLLNSYLRKLYNSYGYDEPVLFDMVKDEIIYATTNNHTENIEPTLKQPSVVEPTGANLCPKFDQWECAGTDAVITDNNTKVVLDADNLNITSMLIPWNHRADTMKFAFSVIVNATDYEKLFQLDVRFLDYYKNEISPYTQTSMLVTPSQAELTEIGGAYADGIELVFENKFDTSDSNILSKNVSYIQIKISVYEATEGLGSFAVKTPYLITNIAGIYSEYTTNDYSPVAYQYGSKQTSYDQLKSEFLRLVNKIKADTEATTITFVDVPTIGTPSYEVDSILTAAEDMSNLSVEQNGIFGYLKVF